MNPWIFFPLIGAVIGYFTNLMAVKMIFRPRAPILGVQGLIPKRREDLAEKIGETVSSHLITKEDVLAQMPLDKIEGYFSELVGDKVDEFINEKFITLNPMIAAFLSDDLKDKIRQGVVEKMQEMLPEVQGKIVDGLDDMDMSALVADKIRGFDVKKLEDIILSICRKELRAIEILGGALGAVVGLAQCFLVHYGVISFG